MAESHQIVESKTYQSYVVSHWWLIVRLLLFGALVIVLAVAYEKTLDEDWRDLKQWLAHSGMWGPAFFVLVTGVLTIVLFPDTPLSILAGALFGLTWGTLYAYAGTVLGATLAFWISRLLLRHRVSQWLGQHPRWSAIEQAACREGIHLQLLVRLTPIHSAMFSYVMGASRLSYRSFIIGCLGMIPVTLMEVYLGYLANHMASGSSHVSTVQTAAKCVGLLVGMAVVVYVARLAGRAIAESAASDDQATEASTNSATPTSPE